MNQTTGAQTLVLVARLGRTRFWSLPVSRVSLVSLSPFRTPVCSSVQWRIAVTSLFWVELCEKRNTRCWYMRRYVGRGSFFLSRGTFKLKYLEIEETTAHWSIKNIQIKKKWSGVSCTHSEQQCCPQPNSWLLKPSRERGFLKARPALVGHTAFDTFVLRLQVCLCRFLLSRIKWVVVGSGLSSVFAY